MKSYFSQPRYCAVVERSGEWWAISIPEVGVYTQAATTDEIEMMARDAIAVMLDVDISTVRVEVRYRCPDPGEPCEGLAG